MIRRISEWWCGTVESPLTWSQTIARSGLIFLLTLVGCFGLMYFLLFVWFWPE